MASQNSTCPACAYSVPPAEILRVSTEEMKCHSYKYGANLNSELRVFFHEFYKAHRCILALMSFCGAFWFSGNFLIYSGRYGKLHLGKWSTLYGRCALLCDLTSVNRGVHHSTSTVMMPEGS
jgi:hypothetical protein